VIVTMLSPTDGIVWTGKVKFLSFRTVEGSMGVLPQRAPIVTHLSVDFVKIIDENETEHLFATYGGFLHCDGEKVSIVSSKILKAEDIDPHIMKSADQRAKYLIELQNHMLKDAKMEVTVKTGRSGEM